MTALFIGPLLTVPGLCYRADRTKVDHSGINYRTKVDHSGIFEVEPGYLAIIEVEPGYLGDYRTVDHSFVHYRTVDHSFVHYRTVAKASSIAPWQRLVASHRGKTDVIGCKLKSSGAN